MAGGCSKQGFKPRFFLVLLACPPKGMCPPLRVTWDLTLVALGPARCAAAFCPTSVRMQVKAQPSGRIP